jgi:trehalose synthase
MFLGAVEADMNFLRSGRRLLTAVIILSLFWTSTLASKEPQQLSTASPDILSPSGNRQADNGQEANYIQWLEKRSMLSQAAEVTSSLPNDGSAWRTPYAKPQPRKVVKEASVWMLAYPGSVITRPGQSVIGAWADPRLWEVFQDLGIDLLHTGPVKRAGGIRNRKYTPSVDGWFDRISLEIDPQLGSEADYCRMVEVAAAHGGKIAGDLVPLHTGKGADFLLALRAYKDYPGMYLMVEIQKEDWDLLPAVKSSWESAPLPDWAAKALTRKRYIPGLINSNDASKEALELTGWDATGEIVGVDGKSRRWVYLHFFKPGQPTLDWLHPSNAAERIVAGDLIQTIDKLGAGGVRLDAVPFLGVEPVPGSFMTWHYQHTLSVWGTDYLAFLARKYGGWTFHELNVPLKQLKPYIKNGPDLSYDFFTRTQVVHSLLIGDAFLLRQAFRFLLDENIQPVSLVHDLQNHDEITYQLVELEHRGDEVFTVGGKKMTGWQLREQTLDQMRTKAANSNAPYNMLYRPQKDGIATTFAGFVAASLNIADPYHATQSQVAQIKQGHLLLAMANAMQPGVFSLSSWDLVGALPLPASAVADRLEDQDYRWINRGAVDLLGDNPSAAQSTYGLPRAKELYGSLPEQLSDPNSFASRLKKMLGARRKYKIALGTMIAVPEVEHSALCVLVFRLPEKHSYAVTALNFGRNPIREEIDLSAIEKAEGCSISDWESIDAITEKPEGAIGEDDRYELSLDPLTGKTLIFCLGLADH